jgi:hypothetical protein
VINTNKLVVDSRVSQRDLAGLLSFISRLRLVIYRVDAIGVLSESEPIRLSVSVPSYRLFVKRLGLEAWEVTDLENVIADFSP